MPGGKSSFEDHINAPQKRRHVDDMSICCVSLYVYIYIYVHTYVCMYLYIYIQLVPEKGGAPQPAATTAKFRKFSVIADSLYKHRRLHVQIGVHRASVRGCTYCILSMTFWNALLHLPTYLYPQIKRILRFIRTTNHCSTLVVRHSTLSVRHSYLDTLAVTLLVKHSL